MAMDCHMWGVLQAHPLNLRRLEVLSTYKIFYLQKNILISDPQVWGGS